MFAFRISDLFRIWQPPVNRPTCYNIAKKNLKSCNIRHTQSAMVRQNILRALEIDRPWVINTLANAARTGRLGFFVGTGFSIAATGGKAHTFEKLLLEIAKKLEITQDFKHPTYCLKSLPQIASKLVEEYEKTLGDKANAIEEIRLKVSEICNYLPLEATRRKFVESLKTASPSWIITTNYDLILEALMENSESILPSQALFPNTARVPIYHLHGHRHYPSSICITEEDYVSRLAPLDYQRLKLPLLFFESTTLFLGYALGDINVRAAVEWSKSFQPTYPNRSDPEKSMVQAIYSETPESAPYIGPNGQLIIEIEDVAGLLGEIGEVQQDLDRQEKSAVNDVDQFLFDPDKPKAVMDDKAARVEFLGLIEKALPYARTAGVADFLQRAIDPVWTQARARGGFEYYNKYLKLILDILDQLNHRSASPLLVAYIAQCLERVGWYIDPTKPAGTAHAATNTWLSRSPKLSKDLVGELRAFANSNSFEGLSKMLNFIPPFPATVPSASKVDAGNIPVLRAQ